jgi:hypothetical protein
MNEFSNRALINRRRTALSRVGDLFERTGRVLRKLLDHASVKRSDRHFPQGVVMIDLVIVAPIGMRVKG